MLFVIDGNEYTIHSLRSAATDYSAWFTSIVSLQVLLSYKQRV
jgi:hypothetical protein